MGKQIQTAVKLKLTSRLNFIFHIYFIQHGTGLHKASGEVFGAEVCGFYGSCASFVHNRTFVETSC